MDPITQEELLNLPKRQFIERCQKWIKEFNGGKFLKVEDPCDCPLAIWVAYNHAKCKNEFVPTTAKCPICGQHCCPDCSNHCVAVLSRVTGYYQPISGWNAAKRQEFDDRTHYNDLDKPWT